MDRAADDPALGPDEALAKAQRLLDDDLPFPAHDVLEAAWKASEGERRALWQGLAQLAVGLTHAQRGNAAGAESLLVRGAERIGPFAASAPHDVDVTGLVCWATALAGRIRSDGAAALTAMTEADRRPRLRSVQDTGPAPTQD